MKHRYRIERTANKEWIVADSDAKTIISYHKTREEARETARHYREKGQHPINEHA